MGSPCFILYRISIIVHDLITYRLFFFAGKTATRAVRYASVSISVRVLPLDIVLLILQTSRGTASLPYTSWRALKVLFVFIRFSSWFSLTFISYRQRFKCNSHIILNNIAVFILFHSCSAKSCACESTHSLILPQAVSDPIAFVSYFLWSLPSSSVAVPSPSTAAPFLGNRRVLLPPSSPLNNSAPYPLISFFEPLISLARSTSLRLCTSAPFTSTFDCHLIWPLSSGIMWLSRCFIGKRH